MAGFPVPGEPADLPLPHPGDFVHVCGAPIFGEIERARHPSAVDHYWITLDVPPLGATRLDVPLFSRKNRNAGFDCRIRLAALPGMSPEGGISTGIERAGWLDYNDLERDGAASVRVLEPDAMAHLLEQKTQRALLVEAWGEFYFRNHPGMHDIHCRRASCAVPTDLRGKDGALRFHYPDGLSEMLLIRFCGQA